jgi:hypothetical protein
VRKQETNKEQEKSHFSPRMAKKITAALELAVLESELDNLAKTSFDSATLFGIKATEIEDQIQIRIQGMLSLGVSDQKVQEATICAQALMNILSNKN